MTSNPQKLAVLKLWRPIYFLASQTGQSATPAELKQWYIRCRVRAKPVALLHILGLMGSGRLGSTGLSSSTTGVTGRRAVVFCPSVDTAHRLARLLQLAI